MNFRFGPFDLDAAKFELRRGGMAVAVEPQVLAVLLHLVANRERLVTRDALIAAVWNGRIVSDAAVASRIKSARAAIGDDGVAQALIRTVHGHGFRFVATVDATPPAGVPAERPSIAVLPFRCIGDPGPHAVIADALPHELIAELSRLRWLFVIARGSSFRFRRPRDLARVGAVLGVRYCLSGSFEASAGRIAVTVELADTRDRGIIWSERYAGAADAVHDIRARIAASTVSALELRIPLHEARAARLTAPEQLDAWASYHRGLARVFRFTRADTAAAIALFDRAAGLDPGFARAHAGLSFAHFQNAFLNYTEVAAAAAAARRHAETALALDPIDPFANLTMGRAHWLGGEVRSSLGWLDRATVLNPNYAQGIYARAWAATILGHGADGQRDADAAMALSPIDPLHYAMLGTRALSHLVRGDAKEAARWSDRAARAPGAHVLIAVIAIAAHALAGDLPRAQGWAEIARRRCPGLAAADFFRSFPFEDAATRARITNGLATAGL